MGSNVSKPQKNQQALSTTLKNHLDITSKDTTTPDASISSGMSLTSTKPKDTMKLPGPSVSESSTMPEPSPALASMANAMANGSMGLDGTLEASFDGPFPSVASESTNSDIRPQNISRASRRQTQQIEQQPESDSSLQILEELSTPAAKKAAASLPTPQSRQSTAPRANTKKGREFDSSDSEIRPRVTNRRPKHQNQITKPRSDSESSDSDIRPPVTKRARRAPAPTVQSPVPAAKAQNSDSSLQILEDISARPAQAPTNSAPPANLHASPSPAPRPRPSYTYILRRSASVRASARLRQREEMRRTVERANRRTRRLAIRNRARRARAAQSAGSDAESENADRLHPSEEQANVDPSELMELSDDESEMDVYDNSQAKFVGWRGNGDEVRDSEDDWPSDEIPTSGDKVILTVSSEAEDDKENKSVDVEMVDVDRASQSQLPSDSMDVDRIPCQRQAVGLSALPVIDEFSRILSMVPTNSLPPAQAADRTSRINQLRRRQRGMMGNSRKGKGLSAKDAFVKAVKRAEELARERGVVVASEPLPGSGVSEMGDVEVAMVGIMEIGKMENRPSWREERTLDDVRANLEARVMYMKENIGRK